MNGKVTKDYNFLYLSLTIILALKAILYILQLHEAGNHCDRNFFGHYQNLEGISLTSFKGRHQPLKPVIIVMAFTLYKFESKLDLCAFFAIHKYGLHKR